MPRPLQLQPYWLTVMIKIRIMLIYLWIRRTVSSHIPYDLSVTVLAHHVAPLHNPSSWYSVTNLRRNRFTNQPPSGYFCLLHRVCCFYEAVQILDFEVRLGIIKPDVPFPDFLKSAKWNHFSPTGCCVLHCSNKVSRCISCEGQAACSSRLPTVTFPPTTTLGHIVFQSRI
jgi:hypothetical protein